MSGKVVAIGVAVGLLMMGTFAAAQSVSTGKPAHPSPSSQDATLSGPDIWDANHDGVYTCDEWKSYLDRVFAAADRNHDGRLSPSEFVTIRRAAAAFAEADFGYFDENQDGVIARKEFVEKPSEFILKYDKNGDCRVTQDEMKATSNSSQSSPRRGKAR